MKRRKVIALIVCICLISVLISCATPSKAPAPAKPIELRFATFIPPTDVYAEVQKAWATELEKSTNGIVKVTFYHAGSLVKAPELLDAVAAGTADIAFCNLAFYPDRLPLNQVMSLPTMLFSTSKQSNQVWWALHNKYSQIRDEYTKAGVKILWFNMPGPNQIEGNKPIKTLEDLKGLKIAVDSKEEIEAMKLLGAVPVILPGGEKYLALQRGVVDVSTQNWNGSRTWKTFEVTKHRTENIDLSFRIPPTIMNIKTYNNLPEDIKKIFDKVTDSLAWSKRSGEEFDKANANARNTIIADHDKAAGNPPIYRLTDSEKNRWRALVKPIQDEWANQMEAKKLPGKAILADLIKFADQYK